MKICYHGKFKVDYKITDNNIESVIPAGTSCIITEEHSMYEDTVCGQIVQSEFTNALIFQDFSQITKNDMNKKRFYITVRVRREDIQKVEEFQAEQGGKNG